MAVRHQLANVELGDRRSREVGSIAVPTEFLELYGDSEF